MSMMAEHEFWELIKKNVVRRRTGAIDTKRLKKALSKLSPDQILGFHQRMQACFVESYTWRLWGAAWLIHGGAPADTFDYFRSWLIGCGREIFKAATKDPDSLASVATPEALDDQLYCIGEVVFSSVAGDNAPSSGFKLPKLTKDLNFDDPNEMSRAYPSLFKKFAAIYGSTDTD